MKTNYLTGTEPTNYEGFTNDSNRHLRYSDYKHLKNVDWGADKSIVISDIMGLVSLIFAIVSIIAVLFLGV